ncbi:hypothetical protein VMCG_01799 [Cytospora schulzeri]|uniref:Uncharacterized protein n=1 Tax=Cytospora schulzeri TaxID=448051 RepID=A0A423X3A4_9PEZI|nr:hypothetical protein VMCG_01799 [Valsa malicola]
MSMVITCIDGALHLLEDLNFPDKQRMVAEVNYKNGHLAGILKPIEFYFTKWAMSEASIARRSPRVDYR